jgi:hypothetical protein
MFYRILDQLAARLGGPWRLRDYPGSSGCPPQGAYFFCEDGENRTDGSMRVVRAGTHALTAASNATLWGRLRQHRGQLAGRDPGGGNHRAPVFRRHVGAALIRRDGRPDELLRSWLDRHRPPSERASQETRTEHEVSRHIGAMPFLRLNVPGQADRGYLESNTIALLSCHAGEPDLPQPKLARPPRRTSRNPPIRPVERPTRHWPLPTRVPPATSRPRRSAGATTPASGQ